MWTEFEPYVYRKSNNKIGGIIPDLWGSIIQLNRANLKRCEILSRILKECCSQCWKFNFTQNVSRVDISTSNISYDVDLVLPYNADIDDTQHETTNLHFVSLLKKPSVVYVTKRESNRPIPRKMIGAVWNAWPVLIFALLLSIISGVIIWILELWVNPDEFPRSFVQGSWEGFWWAFVSMTTVGYGDRAPRTLLGRGFAVFWIMLGICICSIFTATLTTSLTAISLEEKKTLSRAKVGALRNSYEAHTGVKKQAKVISYNSTDELIVSLRNDVVEGILFDSYFSATDAVTDIMKMDKFKISETVVVDDRAWGILVKNDNLSFCLRKNILVWASSEFVTDIIADEVKVKSDKQDATDRSDSVFDPTGDIFWPSLYVCIGFLVVILFGGVVWEFFIKKRIFESNKTSAFVDSSLDASNLDNMEQEIMKKIQSLFSEWRAQRQLEIGTASPMDNEDVQLSVMPSGKKQ
ncbi:uncharacterized protein LOC124449029 [Xenia sp. Carnegie-2017]|uniref:uncharacterized protein LOC124449029 n=1 Tax=Xenia sp. Carnegie-2017 TaxID=2897299 RepID=UPI001F047C26|nr:uncharacterized protein LOC124449029 [Xenia sp. Carnegie-2017]